MQKPLYKVGAFFDLIFNPRGIHWFDLCLSNIYTILEGSSEEIFLFVYFYN